MAGKKGMKGSGGRRPGAGRKPKPKEQRVRVELESQPHGGALKRSHEDSVPIQGSDTLKLLQDVAFGRVEASSLQVRAAIAAVQYTHAKRGEGGKKDAQRDKAGRAAAGKFAPAAPPKLVAADGKRLN